MGICRGSLLTYTCVAVLEMPCVRMGLIQLVGAVQFGETAGIAKLYKKGAEGALLVCIYC